jgi:hypothetical protein
MIRVRPAREAGAGVKTSHAWCGFLTREGGVACRDWRSARREQSRRPNHRENLMNTYYDDLATALIGITLCVAAVSMFVVVFAA